MVASVQPVGFTAIVEYTAPPFGVFLNLIALSVINLRHQNRNRAESAFRPRLFPLLPLCSGPLARTSWVSSVHYAATNQGGSCPCWFWLRDWWPS